MAIQGRDTFSPREQIQMEYDERMLDKQIAHAREIKELELEAVKFESKWSVLFKIPLMIIKLPVLLLLGVGFIVGSFKEDYEPSESFWNLLR